LLKNEQAALTTEEKKLNEYVLYTMHENKKWGFAKNRFFKSLSPHKKLNLVNPFSIEV